MAVTHDLFRALLRRHAAGVVVITAAGDRPCGFTATSFASVSVSPPLVLFCVQRSSSVFVTMNAVSHVGIHILGRDQETIARTFATRGIDRFAAPLRWASGPHGVPVLHDVAAILLCRVVDRIDAGDHMIVLAEVAAGSHEEGTGHTALVYHMGQYARLAEEEHRLALSAP